MQQHVSTHATSGRTAGRRGSLPWLILGGLLLLLLVLVGAGEWRAAGTGPQVQVPMFYDAHYLYPRPWTQEQAAPGIPAAAPVALYGANRVSQAFLAGSDQLATIAVPLAGPPGSVVSAVLADDAGRSWQGEFVLAPAEGARRYTLTLAPLVDSAGRRFELRLSAPAAEANAPVIAYTVGGDRVGATYDLNAFSRPGNLQLTTYARGRPGGWWFAAFAEQLLPAAFRLRLQQYKPPAFKGELFASLLGITAVLSVALLWLARPQPGRRSTSGPAALAWTLVILISAFLLWQVVDGRLRLPVPGAGRVYLDGGPAVPVAEQPPSTGDVVYMDLAADLWSAAREPEARFVQTAVVDGLPAVTSPAGSRVRYALDVPPDGRLRAGLAAVGPEPLTAEIRANDVVVAAIEVPPQDTRHAAGAQMLDVDLAPWQGQGLSLTLAASKGSGAGGELLWLMPQITTSATWLLRELPAVGVHAAGHTFSEGVILRGFALLPEEARAGEALTVRLYWEVTVPAAPYGTVFVHLVDEAGELVAQHDGQPVGNVFPFPRFHPGQIVRDDHVLTLPQDLAAGRYSLYAGIYDPGGQRWPVTNPDGSGAADGRALLSPDVMLIP